MKSELLIILWRARRVLEGKKQPWIGKLRCEGQKCRAVSRPGQWWSRHVVLLQRAQDMLRERW